MRMFNQRFRAIVPWIIAACMLVAGLGLVYPQVMALKGCLLTGDHREQHYPWAVYLSESLARGELPWWTWKIHCGFPLLAEGQIGAFYPPNLLLHGLLTADPAYAINFLLHMFLSGFFFLLYGRNVGWGWAAAALGCMAYLMGNAFGGAFYNITSLKTLCWFPLALWCVDKINATGRKRYGLLLGIVFGFQLLAGYLQIAVYSIAMTLLYAVIFSARRLKTTPLSRSPFMIMFVAFIIAAIIFLPQFLATYPLSRLSGRVGMHESFAYIGSFPPWGLVTLFFPKLEGLLRTLGVYVGILPLFFVCLSLAAWKQAAIKRWWIFSLLALLLAMGGYSPLYVALVKLTHFYGFRVPSKLLFFVNTGLAILAGWGMDAWRKQRISAIAMRRTAWIFSCLALGALACLWLGGIALKLFHADMQQFGYALVEKVIHGKPYHPHGMEHYRASVDSLLALAGDLTRLTNPKIALSACMLLLAVAAIWGMRRLPKVSWAAALCLVLAAGDLYAYRFTNKLVGDFSTFEAVRRPPDVVSFLQKDPSLFRVFGYRGVSEDLSLVPSYNFLFGLEDIGAYSPFVTKRYRELLEGLGAADDSTGRSVKGPDFVFKKMPLLSMLNVKYIVTPKSTELPGMPVVFQGIREHVYENKRAEPRFFFARDIRVETDAQKLLEQVRNADETSTRTIWLEESSAIAPGQGSVEVSACGDDKIKLLTDSEGPGTLFASLLHYPGLRATVDGHTAKIFRANYCFSAVQVPAGRHEVEFFYDGGN